MRAEPSSSIREKRRTMTAANVRKTTQITAFCLIRAFAAPLSAGCQLVDSVYGVYEETADSGRLLASHPEADAPDNYRFFRFNLRQYGDEVGGIFESFDLPSYSDFSRMPETVNYRISSYYCSRIEYGYARNGYLNIYFTDKSQRRWLYSGLLEDNKISGRIYRVSQNGGKLISESYGYLMDQDRAYYEQSGSGDLEMILRHREKSETSPLSCMYYYKTSEIEFSIPESVYAHCGEAKFCSNLRLAAVGSQPISASMSSAGQTPIFTEILSATLSDIDRGSGMRLIAMRDTPYAELRNASGLFIATAFVYDDANLNGVWDSDEAIYAGMRGSFLAFSDETAESEYAAVLGVGENKTIAYNLSLPDGMPIGWNVVEERSRTEANSATRSLTQFLKTQSAAALTEWTEDGAGCYYAPPAGSGKPMCEGIFPVLHLAP